jgi:hypothetical protein
MNDNLDHAALSFAEAAFEASVTDAMVTRTARTDDPPPQVRQPGRGPTQGDPRGRCRRG